MKEKKPLISVIVPCYNVEPYVSKCIESIINQSYITLEIILVDDGSSDNSGKICDEFAQKDNRITVIHKKNGGLSDARNVGIEIAKGEYFTFIDSDDYITDDYIDSLYELIVTYQAQMSISVFNSFYEGSVPTKDNRKTSLSKVFNSEEALITMFYQKDFDNNACAKLYHRSLFNNIRFPKGKLYEDLATTYLLIQQCKKIAYTNYKNYYYLLRSNSIEGAPFKPIKLESCIEITNQLVTDSHSMSKNVAKALNCRIISFLFHILLEIPQDQKQLRQPLLKKIKELRLGVLLDRNARIKARIACLLSYGGYSIVQNLSHKALSRKKVRQ